MKVSQQQEKKWTREQDYTDNKPHEAESSHWSAFQWRKEGIKMDKNVRIWQGVFVDVPKGESVPLLCF